jgi:hypothetical protein
MAQHSRLKIHVGVQVYFCNPNAHGDIVRFRREHSYSGRSQKH